MYLTAFASSGHIYFGLTFLELFPKYNCPDEIPDCKPIDRCLRPDIVTIDWDSEKSLHNWVDPLNLECTLYFDNLLLGEKTYLIGLLGSIYFVGWLTAAFVVPRLGDILGRKKPFIYSLAFSIPLYLGLILSRNIYVNITLFLFLGMCQEGKLSVCFVYLLEFMPIKYYNIIGTLFAIWEGLTLTCLAIYFRYISKEWIYYQIFGLSLNVLCFITLVFVPESPKFLYSAKRYQEAKQSLAFVAKFNRVKNYHVYFKFVTELSSIQLANHSISSIVNTTVNSNN